MARLGGNAPLKLAAGELQGRACPLPPPASTSRVVLDWRLVVWLTTSAAWVWPSGSPETKRQLRWSCSTLHLQNRDSASNPLAAEIVPVM